MSGTRRRPRAGSWVERLIEAERASFELTGPTLRRLTLDVAFGRIKNAEIGEDIQSASWDGTTVQARDATDGWKIQGDGWIGIENLVARGDLYGNWDGGDDLSTGYDASATTGFFLDGSAGVAQFTGALYTRDLEVVGVDQDPVTINDRATGMAGNDQYILWRRENAPATIRSRLGADWDAINLRYDTVWENHDDDADVFIRASKSGGGKAGNRVTIKGIGDIILGGNTNELFTFVDSVPHVLFAVPIGPKATTTLELRNDGSGGIDLEPDGDVVIYDDAGAVVGRYDDQTDDRWEFLKPLDMGSNKITSVTDPTVAQDAATKQYVDDNRTIIKRAKATAAFAPGSADTWTTITNCTVTIPQADVPSPFTISAILIGEFENLTSATQVRQSRVRIAIDGGTVWDNGDAPIERVGTTAGRQVGATSANALESQTPTGDIKVEGQVYFQTNLNGTSRRWMLIVTVVPV